MLRAFYRAILSVLGLCLAAFALPAAAQFKSDGYKFLEAVEDRDGDVATQMLKEPGSVVVNTRDITSGETGLHIAAKRRDALWVRFLTQNGANPNIGDKNGATPLQIASTLGSIEVVTALLKAGANVDVANDAGETPLIAAVHKRDVPMVRLLLANKANPDRSDNSGRSARDYVDLQIGNSLMLSEFKKADEERAGSGEQKTYGPSF